MKIVSICICDIPVVRYCVGNFSLLGKYLLILPYWHSSLQRILFDLFLYSSQTLPLNNQEYIFDIPLNVAWDFEVFKHIHFEVKVATLISNHLEGREICCGLRILQHATNFAARQIFYYHIFNSRYLKIYYKSGNKESRSAAAIKDLFDFHFSYLAGFYLYSPNLHMC